MSKISQAENQWLTKIYTFVEQLFADSYIPSHDHTHHIRVWENAKQLIGFDIFFDNHISQNEIEAIFFACMFHDTGLTVTLSEDHGKQSNIIFIEYCHNNNIHPTLLQNISEAIENHDNKLYLQTTDTNIISTILNLSDDLDAFGVVGIFRYAEIYTHRNISIDKIPQMIIANINSRWANLEKHITQKDSGYKQYRTKHKEVVDFYSENNIDEAFQLLKIIEKSRGKYSTITDLLNINSNLKTNYLNNLSKEISKQ